jgi:hypothetical protein
MKVHYGNQTQMKVALVCVYRTELQINLPGSSGAVNLQSLTRDCNGCFFFFFFFFPPRYLGACA